MTTATVVRLLPILISTDNQLTVRVHLVRSALINHVFQTHVLATTTCPSPTPTLTTPTAMPATEEEFQHLRRSLSSLVNSLLPPLVALTSTNTDTFSRALVTFCCASCKAIPISREKRGSATKERKEEIRKAQKVMNRTLSDLHGLLIASLSADLVMEEETTHETTTATMARAMERGMEQQSQLPPICLTTILADLLRGASREMSQCLSLHFCGGYVELGSNEDVAAAFESIRMSTRRAHSTTVRALKLCKKF